METKIGRDRNNNDLRGFIDIVFGFASFPDNHSSDVKALSSLTQGGKISS